MPFLPIRRVPTSDASADHVESITRDVTVRPTYGGNRKNWYGLQDRDFRKERSDVFTAAFEHQFDDTHRIRNATRYTKVTQDYIWTQPDDSQNNVPRGEVWRRMNSRYSNAETLQNLTDLTGEAVIGGLKHQYAVGPDVPVLLDGGVRWGTDIVKSLALGARAVLIGRPQLHALAVAGMLGVAHLLHILRGELELAMAQLGCATVSDIGPHLLRSPPPHAAGR